MSRFTCNLPLVGVIKITFSKDKEWSLTFKIIDLLKAIIIYINKQDVQTIRLSRIASLIEKNENF